VDHSATSPFRDRIFGVIWHNNRPAFVSFRNSNYWHAPIQVATRDDRDGHRQRHHDQCGRNGLLAVWPDTGSRGISA
jgi:hypothetical protein